MKSGVKPSWAMATASRQGRADARRRRRLCAHSATSLGYAGADVVMENLASACPGIGWCAAQHIAAFQKNPHAARDLAARPRCRAGARHARAARPVAARRRAHDALRGSARGAGRRHHLDRDAQPSARRRRRWPPRGRASTSCSRSRPASTKPSWCGSATRCARPGVRTIVSFELRYNPYLKFARWLRESGWLGELRFARTQYLSQRHRLVPRLGLGAHPRERPQPSARGRLPRRRRAALVLGPRGRRGERVSYALHRRLRVADVDRRQRDGWKAARSAT